VNKRQEAEVRWAGRIDLAARSLKKNCAECDDGPRPAGGCGGCIIEQAPSALGVPPPKDNR
jgi:hypothetical protein